MKKICFIFLCCLFLGSCGVSQQDYDKINNENSSLRSENSSLKEENAAISAEKERLEAQIAEIAKAEEAKRLAEEATKAAEQDKAADKEKAREEQLVIVESAKITVQSNSDKFNYPDMMSAEIKNVSDDTIKNYTIGFLAYDKDGFPLQVIGSSDYTGDVYSYEKLGFEQGVNILPDKTFGDKTGWGVEEDHGVVYLIACVKEAEFFNQGDWKNPYYKFWLEEFAEKQVNVEVLKNMYK